MTTTPRPATLHCYLGYRDAQAALRWLESAFGFETTSSFPDDHGGIMHAEIRLGDAALTLFTDEVGYDRPSPKGDTVGQGVYISVADTDSVDAIWASAHAAGGATPVWEPGWTEWGNYRCRVRDPEGIEWTLGTHQPGVPVDPNADWSDSSDDAWTEASTDPGEPTQAAVT